VSNYFGADRNAKAGVVTDGAGGGCTLSAEASPGGTLHGLGRLDTGGRVCGSATRAGFRISVRVGTPVKNGIPMREYAHVRRSTDLCSPHMGR
jgi:hypothetical protein